MLRTHKEINIFKAYVSSLRSTGLNAPNTKNYVKCLVWMSEMIQDVPSDIICATFSSLWLCGVFSEDAMRMASFIINMRKENLNVCSETCFIGDAIDRSPPRLRIASQIVHCNISARFNWLRGGFAPVHSTEGVFYSCSCLNPSLIWPRAQVERTLSVL